MIHAHNRILPSHEENEIRAGEMAYISRGPAFNSQLPVTPVSVQTPSSSLRGTYTQYAHLGMHVILKL